MARETAPAKSCQDLCGGPVLGGGGAARLWPTRTREKTKLRLTGAGAKSMMAGGGGSVTVSAEAAKVHGAE